MGYKFEFSLVHADCPRLANRKYVEKWPTKKKPTISILDMLFHSTDHAVLSY